MGAGAAVPFVVSAHVQVGNVCTEGLVPAEAPFREALANGVTSNVGTVPSIRIVRPIVAAVVARFAEQLVVAALAEHNLPLPVLRLLRHPAFAATAPSFGVRPGVDDSRGKATDTFFSTQGATADVAGFCAAVVSSCGQQESNSQHIQL